MITIVDKTTDAATISNYFRNLLAEGVEPDQYVVQSGIKMAYFTANQVDLDDVANLVLGEPTTQVEINNSFASNGGVSVCVDPENGDTIIISLDTPNSDPIETDITLTEE